MFEPAAKKSNRLPPLSRDPSFWGMTATQFLGAFNDNLFKQLVLLICVDYAARRPTGEDVYQPIAMALFAIPFVLFSGFGGWLSDRHSKRTIVVLCKVAEIAVMLLGMVAFLSGRLSALFVVLFCMSTQSAYFGPAKYGILPEMLRERDLPQANGVIQMTTFVAIIFGMAAAGFSKQWFGDRLWVVSGMCISIAVLGTLSSLAVRKVPVAHPGLAFGVSALGINRDTWKLLRSDRQLFGVLMISSLFWFIGGVVQPAVNAFGKLQMRIGDGRTSIMAASMGVGIAAGCVLAGKASHKQVNFRLVRFGAWGIVACLVLAAGLGAGHHSAVAVDADQASASFWDLMQPASTLEWLARLSMGGLGIAAGFFIVPLQVFLQARPPGDQKGRMIGAMNLINWIGIVFSALFYQVCISLLDAFQLRGQTDSLQVSWVFAALAVLMLPVAVFYRPRDEALQ